MTKKQTKSQKGPGKVWSFEVPPPPIPAKDIKEIVDTDIVVAGAGVAGLPAAVSAAEMRAKVVLLEKYVRTAAPGMFTGVIGSKLQKKMGIEIDKEDIIRKLVAASEGRADGRLVRKWADRNGKVMDWLIDMADAAGIVVNVYGTGHTIGKGMEEEQALLQMLTNEARRRGVDIRYSTPAVRLLRPGNKGRVTGIIARNADGDYIQFNVNKAVILCTGDYGNNPEMMRKYCSWAVETPVNMYWPNTNTGDGHQMGLWIGGAIEDPPHCAMIHFNSTNEKPAVFGRPMVGDRGTFLYVNKLGERFQNEDQSPDFQATLVMRQPDRTQWQVFDGKGVNDKNREQIQRFLKSGAVLSTNTIEELAPKFGARSEVFKANVDRYNELVRLGKDLDFGKRPELMTTTIDTPPFYVCESPPDLLAVMGGFRRNIEGQVLDVNWNIIPGLYAAGNIAGGFWGDVYPIAVISGIARSHALTFGRLAGLNAAKVQP